MICAETNEVGLKQLDFLHSILARFFNEEWRLIMKLIKNALFVAGTVLCLSVPVAADSVTPGCNSNFYLQYGSGSTYCHHASRYASISGTCNNPRAVLGVQIYQGSSVVRSQSTNSVANIASASYTIQAGYSHSYRANSALMSR